MPTIKDIARAAGVSHGTVSNALSGRGNVSLDKLNRVYAAATKLGYAYNNRAAGLRSGQRSGMAVILPNLLCQSYSDFYSGFCGAAEEGRQAVQLHLTGNSPSAEARAMLSAQSAGVMGVAVVTSAGEGYKPQEISTRTIYVEREAGDAPFLGFDFARAGAELARKALKRKPARVGIMTNLTHYSNERAFFEAAHSAIIAAGAQVAHVEAIARQYAARAFDFCKAGVDVVIASRAEMARDIESAWRLGGAGPMPKLYYVAPRRTVRADEDQVYEMDYRLLGRRAYEALAGENDVARRLLPTSGLRRAAVASRGERALTVRLLTQESPFTNALRTLSPGLKRETGITLSITTFPRNELYEAIDALGETSAYDLIRMDMNWADWYAERLFEPLDELKLDLGALLGKLVDGLDGEYTAINNVRRVLPLEPSTLMLYYRRDLFEDPAICRGYFEHTRRELRVPRTWEDYARVAAYFARAENPASPTKYGGTVTHVACEFLSALLEATPSGHVDAFDTLECVEVLRRYLAFEKRSYHSHAGIWMDTADAFLSGDCATAILFTNYVERIASDPISHVSGLTGLAPLPGARSLLGGGIVGVPKASNNKGAACDFLSWALSDDTAQLLAMLSGCSACKAAYENQEVLALYPWLPVVRGGFPGGARRGILAKGDAPFNAKAMEGQLIIALRSAADGVLSPEAAAKYMQAAYEQLSARI